MRLEAQERSQGPRDALHLHVNTPAPVREQCKSRVEGVRRTQHIRAAREQHAVIPRALDAPPGSTFIQEGIYPLRIA
jgi:hypothetical protein